MSAPDAETCACGGWKKSTSRRCAACAAVNFTPPRGWGEQRLPIRQEPPLGRTKRCSKCRQVRDFCHFARTKSTADGRQYYCRDCMQLDRIARRKGIGPEVGAICTACQKPRLWTQFIQQRGTPTGYMDRCRECVDAAFRHRAKAAGGQWSYNKPRKVTTKAARDEAHYSRYLSASAAG